MRRLWRIAVWVTGITVFLAAFAFWQWQRVLDALGISDLQWEIRDPGFTQLQLSRVSFAVRGTDYELFVSVEDLQVQWRWQAFIPRVTAVNLGRARTLFNQTRDSEEVESEAFRLPEDWHLPDALPEHIFIEHLQADLPCATGRCVITAQARSQWLQDVLTLQLQLQDTPDVVDLDLIYEPNDNQPFLRFAVVARDFIQLNGDTRLPAAQDWQGKLQLNLQPPDESWLIYLKNWYAYDPSLARAFDEPSVVSAEWKLALSSLLLPPPVPATEDRDHAAILAALYAHLHGDLKLTLDLPAPLPVFGLGGLSGKARMDLTAERGVLKHYLLDADLRLEPVTLGEDFAAYGLHLNSLQLTLNSRSNESVDLHSLPLQIYIAGDGNIQFKANADIQLDSETLAVVINKGDLQFSAAQWSPMDGLSLADVNVKQKFTAQWQPDLLHYTLLEPAIMQADITGADFSIKGGRVAIEHLALSGDPASWLEGEMQMKATVSMTQLVQSQLHPQPWRWQGELMAKERQAQLHGTLTANDSLAVNHQLNMDEQHWMLDWQLPDIFLLAGNSLQNLTPHWPPLLSLQRGRIGAEGKLSAAWPVQPETESPVTGTVGVRLADIAGIYDTTAFVGVSGNVGLALKADSFAATGKNLTAGEIILGFSIGPARAALGYNAAFANPAQGQLRIDVLQSELMGGSVEIPAAILDFAKPEQQLQVNITELDLGRLLAEHPSSDLSGSGRLSGSIPLTVSAEGISVTGGKLAARPPGGYLQYRSARATDMAAGSGGMKIITDALDDFHYTLLSSEVSYDTDGKLLLGVRLEGNNPAVEAGRPINFNINLEEDLPVMIFSLQLTNQLNEIIKKRVQEKMRRKPST